MHHPTERRKGMADAGAWRGRTGSSRTRRLWSRALASRRSAPSCPCSASCRVCCSPIPCHTLPWRICVVWPIWVGARAVVWSWRWPPRKSTNPRPPTPDAPLPPACSVQQPHHAAVGGGHQRRDPGPRVPRHQPLGLRWLPRGLGVGGERIQAPRGKLLSSPRAIPAAPAACFF